MLIAECYNDWPSGLEDSLVANNSNWFTDSLHTVLIRSEKNQSHKGKYRNAKGVFTGFCIKGDLDFSAIAGMRVEKLMTAQNNNFKLGPFSSVNRSILGNILILENSNIANSLLGYSRCVNSFGIVNKSVSFYTMAIRDAHKPRLNTNIGDVFFSFYNCTATLIDSGGQPGVSLVNCLIINGHENFDHTRYYEKAKIINCGILSKSKNVLYDSEGKICKTGALISDLVDIKELDFHLTAKDTFSQGNGGATLGGDIDGDIQIGKKNDIGADQYIRK